MKISKKTVKENNIKCNDGWSFAIVNGRLVEIHFANNFGVWAHAYVKRSFFKTKREQKMIDADTKKYIFYYQKGYYYDKTRFPAVFLPQDIVGKSENPRFSGILVS